jgi:hypothetical protein
MQDVAIVDKENEADKRQENAFYQIGYKSIESGDIAHVIDMFYDSLQQKDKYESD